MALKATLLVALSGGVGCSDFFSPSFLRILDPAGTGSFQAVDPPTGHIALAFQNFSQIQDEVFRFLIQGQPVITPELVDEIRIFNAGRTNEETDAFLNDVLNDQPVNFEEWNLPPRVRAIVDVVTTDGGIQRLQFLDGLRLVRGEDQVGENGNITALPPALQQNTNSGFIVQCPIDAIVIQSLEVYVPVVIRTLETVNIGAPGNEIQIVQCQDRTAPQYELLEEDLGFDFQLGTFNLLRNFDPRMVPPALTTLQCGGVVLAQLNGDLTLPFRDIPTDCTPSINPPSSGRAPAYFVDDLEDFLRIPGRYSVSIQVRDQ